MSNSNVTIFNGTFQKLNGERRTMRFIRKSDLPSSMVNEATIFGSLQVFSNDKRTEKEYWYSFLCSQRW